MTERAHRSLVALAWASVIVGCNSRSNENCFVEQSRIMSQNGSLWARLLHTVPGRTCGEQLTVVQVKDTHTFPSQIVLSATGRMPVRLEFESRSVLIIHYNPLRDRADEEELNLIREMPGAWSFGVRGIVRYVRECAGPSPKLGGG